MKDAREHGAQVWQGMRPTDSLCCPRDRRARINMPIKAIGGALQARAAGGRG
jgi:hypothetical protein